MDYGLALVGEAVSALLTGRLRDAAGWSPEQVCAWLATLGAIFTITWAVYTWQGGGAMGYSDTEESITKTIVSDLEASDETDLEDDESDEDEEVGDDGKKKLLPA